MCGIAGIFAYHDSAPRVDREELLGIREAMVARGPDGAGLWMSADQRTGLAHRRLTIIDLTNAGAQPMATADGRLQVTFNGEIYNYRELRKELEASGYRFHSNSDTEVLLHLYAARGPDMVHALRGMYAFAIWDATQQRLFLARDPFGIKPLYYSDNGKTFRFASQVKALLQAGQVDTTPEAAGHVGFFLWGHVPDPYTLYKGVKALPAGASMVVDRNGGHGPRKFFDVSEEFANANEHQRKIPLQETREYLRAALQESVQHHFRADVPVGIFLSSGLDSSTLTALSAEAGSGDLRTITLGFDEYRGTKNDETPLAALVAQRYGTSHQISWVSRRDFEHNLQRLLDVMDQPSIDGVNTYFVSRAAAESGIKVAISGLGGDELFGGYPSFKDLPRMVSAFRIWQCMPRLGKAFRWVTTSWLERFTSPKYAGLLEYGGSYGGAYLLRRGLYMPWELPKFLDGELVRAGWNELQPLLRLEETVRGISAHAQKVSALELTWYMRNQLLRDSDWAGMAHSLEIRVPLVDIELFRQVLPLITEKPLSKLDIARTPTRPLPDEILHRAKTGFLIPVHAWLPETGAKLPSGRGLRGWAHRVHPLPRQQARLLALVTEAFGGHGGIALYNRDLLQALCAYSACSEVVAIPRLMGQPPESYDAKLNYITKGLKSKLSYIAVIGRMLKRNPKFDLILCAHINLLPIAYLVHLVTRAPIILMIYGIDAWKPPRSIFSNHLVGRIAAYVSISKVTQERFLRWSKLRSAKGYVLPNAIHLQSYSPGSQNVALAAGYGLTGKTVLMTLGRLVSAERSKGFDEVLEVLPDLIEHVPNIAYLIVGDGSDRARLVEKATALGLGDRVVFTGFIAEKDKSDIYRLADVYVMASRGEGFGFVILEALATGLPTVASQLDGGREAVRDGMLGILVDPDDANDIKRGILEALQRPKQVPEGLEYFCYANFQQRLHQMMNEWLALAPSLRERLERGRGAPISSKSPGHSP